MTKQLKILLTAIWVVAGLTVGGVVGGVMIYRTLQTNHSPAGQSIASGSDDEKHHLDVLFDAPAFTLIDQDGKKFNSGQLHGKVWVADFVFTTCTGLCPIMTRQLVEFQKQTGGVGIQMVSFSVDPVNDTPAVLSTYAAENKADLTRWRFLTGDKETLWNISQSMKLAVGKADTGDHQVMHSSHFLLVDGDGHVRGIYDYKDAGFMNQLVTDARKLSQP